jgi:hypothetical protein
MSKLILAGKKGGKLFLLECHNHFNVLLYSLFLNSAFAY